MMSEAFGCNLIAGRSLLLLIYTSCYAQWRKSLSHRELTLPIRNPGSHGSLVPGKASEALFKEELPPITSDS